MEMIVLKGYSLSIFDPIDGNDSADTTLLSEKRQNNIEDHLPTSYLEGGEYPDLI